MISNMALKFNNRTKDRKIPVTRNSKFFGNEDFDLELGFSKEYLEQDANQTVILYRVDYEKTNVNDIYKEAKKDTIRFLTPIELPVIYDVQDAEIKAYNKDNQKAIFAQTGKLVFSVLLSTLEEYECDISRGDYIGIQITPEHREYFTVTDDGRVASLSNKFTMYGTKPFARTITAAQVDLGEFRG